MSLRWTLRPRDPLEATYNILFRRLCRRVAVFRFDPASMQHAFATTEPLSVAVRLVPRYARAMMLHPGDFVAYGHREGDGAPEYFIRRVGAMAGGLLTTGEKGEEEDGFLLPQGRCWLMNDEEQPSASAPDSRIWGPVPLDSVVGRVVVARTSTRDGRDEPVLEKLPTGPMGGLFDIEKRPGAIQFWNSEEGDLMDANSPHLLERADAFLRKQMSS